ncbi:fungal hydrophobin domain-containing protein [Trichoderma sp. SZMC 28014]
MKFAITIFAAAVSALPTKDLFPFPIGPIPSYGLPSPPLNGVIPPLNGVIPPLNGVIPPVNGVIPPVNGVVPPVNGVIPPVNGVTPPVNGVIPPVNGVIPPATGNKAENHVCPSGLLYTNPQCCSVDVIGVADLDCQVPSRAPTNGTDFESICAETGKQAHCCAIPVAGQALLCQVVIGADD